MKHPIPEPSSASSVPPVRLPYEKPEFKRVDLAMAETLSQGCKLESDNACTGPPIMAYDGGS